jgi:hypothetical protein
VGPDRGRPLFHVLTIALRILSVLSVPELYTCRYLAVNALSSRLVVPVRISLLEPPFLATLPYKIEHRVRALMPEWNMMGEWENLSPAMWKKLDLVGPELIARQLSGISKRHGDRPLALCCFEDVTRPHRCHRVVFSLWWEHVTGQRVYELTDAGELLWLDRLHFQCMPVLPGEDELFPEKKDLPGL